MASATLDPAYYVAAHRDVLNSLMFSLALAVGLTPQLLPAIISVNLAHGAPPHGRGPGHRPTAGLD